MLLKQVGELDQQLSSVLWCLFPPRTVKCLACRSNGNVDIFLSGFVDRGNDLFGRGVDNLERLAIDRFDELVVDEAGRN